MAANTSEFTRDEFQHEMPNVLQSLDESLQISRTVPNQATPTANPSAPGTSASIAAPTPAAGFSITVADVSLGGCPVTTSPAVITSSTAADSSAASEDSEVLTDGLFETENLTVSDREASVASSTPSPSSAARGESGERGNGGGDYGDRQVLPPQNFSWRPDLVRGKPDITQTQPMNPEMVQFKMRINTYTDWIHEGTHPADDMAKAGFYYTGNKKDMVCCYFCGIKLFAWKPSNRPLVEHCLRYRCPFVELYKGPTFINTVQRLSSASNLPKIEKKTMKFYACLCSKVRISEEQVRESMIMKDSKRGNLSQSAAVLSPEGRAEVPKNTDVARSVKLRGNLLHRDRQEEPSEDKLCCICLTETMNVVLYPCGHLFCAQCAPVLTTCGICRKPVEGLSHVNLD